MNTDVVDVSPVHRQFIEHLFFLELKKERCFLALDSFGICRGYLKDQCPSFQICVYTQAAYSLEKTNQM